jgi:hypothetical protein
MGYYENLLRLYKVADPIAYSNLKKTSKRRELKKPVLDFRFDR